MKRIAVVFFLLTLACPATAGLYITVNGITDTPESIVWINVGQMVVLGIVGDGLTPPPWEGFLIVEGPASMDGHLMCYTGSGSYYKDFMQICEDLELYMSITESFWYATTFSMMRFGDSDASPPLSGVLLDNILLQGEYCGDIVVSLMGLDLSTFYARVVVHVVGTGCGLYEPGQPLAHWKFDEGEGPVAFDSVASNHGFVVGAEWSEGLTLGALSFDGTDDYVRVRTRYWSGLDFGRTDGLAISAWVKTERDGPIINRRKCTGPGGDCCAGYRADVRDGRLFFEIEDDDALTVSIQGDTELTDDQWHHVLAVRDTDSDQLRLYVDGTGDAEPVPDTTIEDLYTTADLRIGRADPNVAPGAEYYKGIIDDVRIYYGALSHEGIRRIYREGSNRYIFYVNAADGNDTNDGLSPQTPFATIQKAIDLAGDGDTVIAAPGTYTGRGNRDINFEGKAISVLGQGGPENCIIDCNGTKSNMHRGFHFGSGAGKNSVLKGFTITNGYTDYGGAIFWYDSSPRIIDCIITGNHAQYGGGICNYYCGAAPTFESCIFTGNSASRGGAIYNSNSALTFKNCTITANHAEKGGTLYNYAGYPRFTNCILWANLPGEIFINSGSAIITFSNIQQGLPGQGNINADPCFAEPGYWDDNHTPTDKTDDSWVNGDYHLKSQAGRWDAKEGRWVIDEVTSPCIDAGDPMTPIGHEPFPNGGRINMGAYGGTEEASKSYFGGPPCETIMAGDINGDCIVDFRDLCIMAVHWCEED